MAVEIGTASNARDLVSKLEKFLTTNPELVQANQAWEVIKDSDGGEELAYVYEDYFDWRAGYSGWTFRRTFIGHGLDGEDTIVVPMGLYVNRKYVANTLCALYATQDSKGDDFIVNLKKIKFEGKNDPFLASIPLRDDEMSYWFVANGRRFIIVAKVMGYYLSMYCGYMLQFGTDLENPYPMYIGGSYHHYLAALLTEQEWDAATDPTSEKSKDHRWRYGRGVYGGGLHDPIYDWRGGTLFRSWSSSCFCNTPTNRVARLVVDYDRLRPYYEKDANIAAFTNGFLLPYRYEREASRIGHVKDKAPWPFTPSGKYALQPIEVLVGETTASEEWSTVGWLQGVYFVSDESNAPEKELIIGDKRYLCFPSMNIKNNRWFALLME